MPRRRLQEILSELHEEVGSGTDLSPEDREALRDLAANLNDVIDTESESDDASILSDLRDATARFESTHPKLTDTLASISDLLRSIGIS